MRLLVWVSCSCPLSQAHSVGDVGLLGDDVLNSLFAQHAIQLAF